MGGLGTTAAGGSLGSRAELDEAAARGDLGRTAVEGNVEAIPSSFMIFFSTNFVVYSIHKNSKFPVLGNSLAQFSCFLVQIIGGRGCYLGDEESDLPACVTHPAQHPPEGGREG